MFKGNLTTFTRFLSEDFSPKIKKLHDVFYKYKFDSPLNFIMIKSDFKRFYESFTQARLSLLYSLELHKDSLFQLSSIRQAKQLDMSKILYKNFEAQVTEMDNILEEYHHLLEHDNFDCSTHISGENFLFKCWFRRYGFPLVCLLGFLVYGYASIMYEMKTKKRDRID